MKSLLLCAAAISLTACATSPYQPRVSNINQPATPRLAQAEAETEAGPMRCETIQVIGSRTPAKRVCQTEEEWTRMRENAREIMRDIERLQNPGDPAG
jgi:hypothetical protein